MLFEVWGDAPVQRCTAHKRRNLLAHAPQRLHEEFKRRIKTRTVLTCAETAAMLFWALRASGQITMRKASGRETLAEKRSDPFIDLAAWSDSIIPSGAATEDPNTMHDGTEADARALIARLGDGALLEARIDPHDGDTVDANRPRAHQERGREKVRRGPHDAA